MAEGRTGSVFLEDFDTGVATTMGAELIEVTLDGERVQSYAVRIDGVTGPDEYNGLIPVFMSDPEDAYQQNLLPQIVISRGSFSPQNERWHPGGHEYLAPAHGATQLPTADGRTIPSRRERKWWTHPYEISYDIHLRAKLRVAADRMLRHVGRHFWSYGQVHLRDSEGEERGYYAFMESVENLSEIADISDRLQGHTLSLRVEGELDFQEPHVVPSQATIKTTVERLT